MKTEPKPRCKIIDEKTYRELMKKMVYEIKIRNEIGYKTHSIWGKEDDGYHALIFTYEK